MTEVIELQNNDKVLVTIDVDIMPRETAEEYTNSVMETIKKTFPKNEVNFIVTRNTCNNIKITIVRS